MNVLHYRSTAELRADASRWDDLWQRSEVAAPTMRAALIADWTDRFAGDHPLAAVAIENNGRLVAALPMIASRTSCFLRKASLPVDDCNLANDILLDVDSDRATVCQRLVEGILESSWSLLWFQTVPFETPRWRTLLSAMEQAGMALNVHEQYRVPVVEMAADWQTYEASVPGKHRRSRRRYRKMMESEGEVRFEVIHSPRGDSLDALLQEGFAIEDRSWKGAQGTSLLRTPSVFEYYRSQAHLLAEDNYLALIYLRFENRPIAFSYAWQSKGIHFCVKLGYDDDFRKYGPGQQMNLRLLEQLHETRDCRELDFWGRLMPWNESWATRTYPLGRVVAAPPRLVSRSLLLGYETILPNLRKLRAAWHGETSA